MCCLQELAAKNPAISQALPQNEGWNFRRYGEGSRLLVVAWDTNIWRERRAVRGQDVVPHSLIDIKNNTPGVNLAVAYNQHHSDLITNASQGLRYACVLLDSVEKPGRPVLAVSYHGLNYIMPNYGQHHEVTELAKYQSARTFAQAVGTLASYLKASALVFGDWNTEFTRYPGRTSFQFESPAMTVQVGG